MARFHSHARRGKAGDQSFPRLGHYGQLDRGKKKEKKKKEDDFDSKDRIKILSKELKSIKMSFFFFFFLNEQDLPDSVQVGGRISPQIVWDYLEKIRATGTKVCFSFPISGDFRS